MNRFKIISLVCISFGFINNCNAQHLLNGDFEINNCVSGNDYLELSNSQFNNLLPNCYSFGTSNTVHIDLITTSTYDGSTYDGLAQSGKWYLALVGDGLEQFSMKLSSPLAQDSVYDLTFYDRGREKNCPALIEIGLSVVNNQFGNLIYTGPEPIVGEWTLRLFSFVAPNSGQFITVRALDKECWTKVDNFCLGSDCIELPDFIMPNVFTPNNDGVNDNFVPVKYAGMKHGRLTVFNRWGNEIFTGDLKTGWDGFAEGKMCSDGVYFWRAEYTDIFKITEVQHGFFTLLR